ncbi:MAG TPA: LPS export ABC transporter permease LptG [Burkholderiaceae bacterium]|nr:LPS export ABC transporter permease LptG [Burkholderiaceae bacterium]
MKTLRIYLWKEIASATGFMLFALLSLFTFFDLVAQLDEIGQRGFLLRHALAYVAFSLPSRTYEVMPIAALIGTIYALSKLAAQSEFTIMRVSGMSTRRLLGSLLGIGLMMVALTFLLGEVVSPPSERLAQAIRLKARGGQISVRDFRTGVWVRDVVKEPDGSVSAYRFINVRQVSPDVGTKGWRIMEFDGEYRLRSIITATIGTYLPGVGWELEDAIETRVPQIASGPMLPTDARTEVSQSPKLVWKSELKPDIFGVLLVQPERMAGWDLAQYIRHLSENRQQTERYEIAFWGKVFYPWAVLVMMALALPFAYLHVRAGGVSFKIFTGVMLGVAFYGMNKLIAHIGLLNTWPPLVVSALPSLVVLALAFGALYWIERR